MAAEILNTLANATLGERFQLGAELGRGGYGVVWRATDMANGGVPCAVKTVFCGGVARRRTRFANEAFAMASLEHAGVVPLVASGELGGDHAGVMYVVMPLYRDGDLLSLINRKRGLPEATARDIFRQLAGALAHSHSLGIAHRDIKPDNIFLDGARAVLGDWGFACNLVDETGEHPLRLTEVVGSLPYLPPECVADRGYLPDQLDIWSLGVVLYTMVMGRLPFYGRSREETRAAIISSPLELSSTASPEVADLLGWMLQRDATRRPTMTQLLSHAWTRGATLAVAVPATTAAATSTAALASLSASSSPEPSSSQSHSQGADDEQTSASASASASVSSSAAAAPAAAAAASTSISASVSPQPTAPAVDKQMLIDVVSAVAASVIRNHQRRPSLQLTHGGQPAPGAAATATLPMPIITAVVPDAPPATSASSLAKSNRYAGRRFAQLLLQPTPASSGSPVVPRCTSEQTNSPRMPPRELHLRSPARPGARSPVRSPVLQMATAVR